MLTQTQNFDNFLERLSAIRYVLKDIPDIKEKVIEYMLYSELIKLPLGINKEEICSSCGFINQYINKVIIKCKYCSEYYCVKCIKTQERQYNNKIYYYCAKKECQSSYIINVCKKCGYSWSISNPDKKGYIYIFKERESLSEGRCSLCMKNVYPKDILYFYLKRKITMIDYLSNILT